MECAGGIAVLIGEPSNELCSTDIDDDEMIEPFFALNPKLRETLRSRGRRGCNLWVRIEGVYPRPCDIKQPDGNPWGEWRATGVCTMIHGVHPIGMSYTRSPEVPPVTISFEDSLRFFLRDNVAMESGSDLSVGEIIQAYAHFCPDQGRDPLPESQIGRQLPTFMLEMFQVMKSNILQLAPQHVVSGNPREVGFETQYHEHLQELPK